MRKQALFSQPAVGSQQRRENAFRCTQDLRWREEWQTGFLRPGIWCQSQRDYNYLETIKQPWKYQEIADAMKAIRAEDMCNDKYGRVRMRQALI